MFDSLFVLESISVQVATRESVEHIVFPIMVHKPDVQVVDHVLTGPQAPIAASVRVTFW